MATECTILKFFAGAQSDSVIFHVSYRFVFYCFLVHKLFFCVYCGLMFEIDLVCWLKRNGVV